MTTRVHFFAFINDLLLVLSKIEAHQPVKYTETGMLDGPVPHIWDTGIQLPNLGEAAGEQPALCDRFLIIRKDVEVKVRSMRMYNGVLRYDVEQPDNPDSVILNAGGMWKDGTLISGSITTISDTDFSQALIRSAKSAIKKHFTRVQAFWVGPEALIAFKAGRRLACCGVQSPPEYDLREEW